MPKTPGLDVDPVVALVDMIWWLVVELDVGTSDDGINVGRVKAERLLSVGINAGRL